MRRALPALAVLALSLAAPPAASAVELVRFDSCRELTRYARERVVEARGGTACRSAARSCDRRCCAADVPATGG
jgi:hypothetical protein